MRLMKQSLGLQDKENCEQLLDDFSLDSVAKYINSDKCKNIITMAGAGISTCKFSLIIGNVVHGMYSKEMFA